MVRMNGLLGQPDRIVNDNTDIYFLVNNNKEKARSAKIRIPDKDKIVLEIWDPATGEISILRARRGGSYLTCYLYFPEAASYILVRRESKKSAGQHPLFIQSSWAPPLGQKLSAGASTQAGKTIRLPASNWVCKRKNLNSLTLDYCQYKTGSIRRWGKPTYVLNAQNVLEKKLKNNTPFSIRYSFKTKLNKRPDSVFLVLERPEQFEIKVNNRKLPYKDAGYGIDTAFKKIDITDCIWLEGQNTIEFKSRFTHPTKSKTLIYVKGGTEIESVYLMGSFNVEGRFKPKEEGLIGQGFVLVDGKEPLASDAVASGYPFYAGEFVFSQEFDFSGNIPKGKRIFLCLDELEAITLKVTLNKKEAGLVLWPPYCLDITDFLKKGRNLIEIEITNSLRNLLGPHHQKRVNLEMVEPESFNDKKNWVEGYTFMPFALSKSIRMETWPESIQNGGR